MLRFIVLSLGLVFSLTVLPAQAGARQISGFHPGLRGDDARFAGQVTNLTGPQNDPNGFSLQLVKHSVDIRVTNNTMFEARSAEAEVEGFLVGDYAVVIAHRVDRAWVAQHIIFDVQPFGPIHQSFVIGTIESISPQSDRIVLQINPDVTRRVAVTSSTNFEVDGQPVSDAPPLTKGDITDIAMRYTDHTWTALTIDLQG